MKKKQKRIGLYWRILGIVGGILLVFFVLGFVTPFGNFYAEHVYPKLHEVVGRFADIFPFSLGELLMYTAAVYGAVTAVLGIIAGIRFLRRKLRKRTGATGFGGFLRGYMKVFLALLVAGLWLYVFHWWIPYHDYVLGTKEHRREFTLEEIRTARNAIVTRMNEAVGKLPRDTKGSIVYPDEETMFRTMVTAMQSLSEEYPRLGGFYGRPKTAWCSDVLEWMGIGGFTYPYVMEATYNKYTSKLFWYDLLTHESAHSKGYYKENEANFIGFISCYRSDDPIMVVSGCLGIFGMMDDYYYGALLQKYGGNEQAAAEEYFLQPQPLPVVYEDAKEAQEVVDEQYAADDHPLEEYKETAEDVAETGWDTQSTLIEGNGYDDAVYLVTEYFANLSAGK